MAPSELVKVYPNDIQKLLQEHSQYLDAGSIRSALSRVDTFNITVENRGDFEEQLASVEKLSFKLQNKIKKSDKAMKKLSKKQVSLYLELVRKVPGVSKMPEFAKFTPDQRSSIHAYLEFQMRNQKVASCYPEAQQLRESLARYNPWELAEVLRISVDLAIKLKNSLVSSTTSKDRRESAQALENPEAAVDPREPAQIIEDILGKLKNIPPKIDEHRERVSICIRLIRIIGLFTHALGFRLETLKEREKIRIRANDTVMGIEMKKKKKLRA